MADFERSTMVWVSPDLAFAYLADPLHLPEYVPVMHHAGTDADEGERFMDPASPDAREPVTFLADEATRRIIWGRADTPYSGSIEVTDGVADGTARVTIHLHTRDDAPRAETEQLLDQAARALLRRLSGR
jgi:hypothetical protein